MNWTNEIVSHCLDMRMANGESEILVTQIRNGHYLVVNLKGVTIMECDSAECMTEWLARRKYEIIGNA